ncbi:hypothetical protein ABH931_006908 [Streptacidiphilus sp. MAP12-33]
MGLIEVGPHGAFRVNGASESGVTIALSPLPRRWRPGQMPLEQAAYSTTLDRRGDIWVLTPAP